MQHKVKATGKTGKYVDATDEKILLELPAEGYSDQPSLQWFDKDDLEQNHLTNLATEAEEKQPEIKEIKPAVKKPVVKKVGANKKISK